MREDVVEMTKRELERWQVIQRVRLGELTQDLAGEILGISEHQIRRLVKKGKLLRARGLVHGSRGVKGHLIFTLSGHRKVTPSLEGSHFSTPRGGHYCTLIDITSLKNPQR